MDLSKVNLEQSHVLGQLKRILGDDYDISQDFLESIIHDLRKLIRKDQKMMMDSRRSSTFLSERNTSCCCSCHSSNSETLSSAGTIISDDAEDTDTLSVLSKETTVSKENIKPKPVPSCKSLHMTVVAKVSVIPTV